MNGLTLKQFRELTKDFDENMQICVPIEPKTHSIRGTVNFVQLAPQPEYTYGKQSYMVIGQNRDGGDELVISELIGKNQWKINE